MRQLAKWLICAALAGGSVAHAEDTSPQVVNGELTDEELLEMSMAETVEVYDQRPDKPFDRDTEVRLTGEQLAARGATDLGSALALLPDVSVRDAGRGGTNIDIRGARKGAVSVLVDGVLVSDPYYGTFDVSTIPITDIVQIRVATTPLSPIDGPGGPGGVIEVLTRDAYGEQLVIARATGDSLPSFGITGTARVRLSKKIALRVAMSGLAGARDMQLPMNASLDEQRRAATGSTRLEYREGDTRLVVDGFLDDRHYVSPPSEESATAPILLIDRETTMRASAKGDVKRGKLQLQAQSWVQQLDRRSRYFRDPAFTDQASFEGLRALRTGGMALATHPIGKDMRWAVSATLDRSAADVTTRTTTTTNVEGDVTIAETAGNLQYEKATIRIDAAAGVAVPFGVGADPWPEGKLVTRWRPSFGPLEVTGTAARKGRVPSLRERFEQGGNAALGPEQISHFEVRAKVEEKDRFKVEAAPYLKLTDGTVRASLDPEDMGMLINLGKVKYYGVDTAARVYLPATIVLGGAYNFVKTDQPETEQRLPHHRVDSWIQGSPHEKLTLIARARFFGKAIDRMQSVPAYALVEFTATAQIDKQHLAVLRVEDALDERPETRAGYFTAGRVITLILQGQWQ
jgi:outer membrane receptor protein involved in Fe transport